MKLGMNIIPSDLTF